MKQRTFKYVSAALFWVIYVLPLWAEDAWPPGKDEDDEDILDEGGAPINKWVIYLLLMATAMGVYYVIKKSKERRIAE